MVDAKKYLEEVKRADAVISMLKAQRDELHLKAVSISSVQSDGVNIQRSKPHGSRTADTVVRYASLEEEIVKRTDAYIYFKDMIARQIEKLPNPTYIQLLDLRYLRYMQLDAIAKELCYSPEHTRKLHGFALAQFQEIYADEIADYFRQTR